VQTCALPISEDPPERRVFTVNTTPGSTSFTRTSPVQEVNNQGVGFSEINVSGLTGTVTDIDVTLRGLSSGAPDVLDVMLFKLHGPSVVLMSDVGGDFERGRAHTYPVDNLHLTID